MALFILAALVWFCWALTPVTQAPGKSKISDSRFGALKARARGAVVICRALGSRALPELETGKSKLETRNPAVGHVTAKPDTKLTRHERERVERALTAYGRMELKA